MKRGWQSTSSGNRLDIRKGDASIRQLTRREGIISPLSSISLKKAGRYRKSFTDGSSLLLLARHSDFECEQAIEVLHGILVI